MDSLSHFLSLLPALLRETGWQLAVALVLAFVIQLLAALLREAPFRRRPEESLEKSLEATLRGLDEHFNKAMQLLSQLQVEVSKRSQAISQTEGKLRALREEEALLKLTEPERKALKRFLRPTTARDVFMSLDFWLGRVALGFVFFLAGLLASWYFRR